MDELTPKEIKDHLRAVLRVSECPTCFNLLRSPELCSCARGHLVCSDCRKKLVHCPVCRSDFDDYQRPLLFRQVLDALPQFCKHLGCAKLVRRGDDHETFCGYRPTTCLATRADGSPCRAVVPGYQLLAHVKHTHGTKPVKKKAGIGFSGNVTELLKYLKDRKTKSTLRSIDDCLFWVTYSGRLVNNKTKFVLYLTIGFYSVPTGTHALKKPFRARVFMADGREFQCCLSNAFLQLRNDTKDKFGFPTVTELALSYPLISDQATDLVPVTLHIDIVSYMDHKAKNSVPTRLPPPSTQPPLNSQLKKESFISVELIFCSFASLLCIAILRFVFFQFSVFK